jgi:hypothetical protein
MIAAPEFLGLSEAYRRVAYVRYGSLPACRDSQCFFKLGNLLS